MSNLAVQTEPNETRQTVDLTTDGGPRRPLPPYVTDADPRTLLNALVAFAERETKGGGLPADLADQLHALAAAARDGGPVISHPAWCERGEGCHRVDEEDGLVSIYHEATLFEATEGDTKYSPGGTWRVQLLQSENYETDGTVDREAVGLYVDVPTASNDGLRGVMLEQFVRAVAIAGHLAAGSPPAIAVRCGCDTCSPVSPVSPDEVFEVVPRRVFHFVGDPTGPGVRGYCNPD